MFNQSIARVRVVRPGLLASSSGVSKESSTSPLRRPCSQVCAGSCRWSTCMYVQQACLSLELLGQPRSSSSASAPASTSLSAESRGRSLCGGSCSATASTSLSSVSCGHHHSGDSLFGHCFNQPVAAVAWPASLQQLSISVGVLRPEFLPESRGQHLFGGSLSAGASTSPPSRSCGRHLSNIWPLDGTSTRPPPRLCGRRRSSNWLSDGNSTTQPSASRGRRLFNG